LQVLRPASRIAIADGFRSFHDIERLDHKDVKGPLLTGLDLELKPMLRLPSVSGINLLKAVVD
jgi:hypothetical protein